MKINTRRWLALTMAMVLSVQTVAQAGEFISDDGVLSDAQDDYAFDGTADDVVGGGLDLEDTSGPDEDFEDWDEQDFREEDFAEDFDFDEDPIGDLIEDVFEEDPLSPEEAEEAWMQAWEESWDWEENEDPAAVEAVSEETGDDGTANIIEGTDEAAPGNAAGPVLGDAQEQASSWKELQEQIRQAQSGEVIVLSAHVTAAADDGELTVEGKDLTIDLNGFSLNRNLGNAADNGSVIRILGGASLTVMDSARRMAGSRWRCS